MLFRDAEVFGIGRADVRVDGSIIAEVGWSLTREAQTIDCHGAALLPGLHDHHVHLLATAAALKSVPCGPPTVRTADELSASLRRVTAPGWVRGTGYHESVAGDLDRYALDRLRSDRPVRMQHRSGALWVLNSAALAELDIDEWAADRAGLERDPSGRPTGRLWRLDGWLRERIAAITGEAAPPDLAAVSHRLAAFGITGVTDATPDLDAAAIALLAGDAVQQSVTLLGGPGGCGPVKVIVPDHVLPELPALIGQLAARRPRPVAIHCVTRAALVLILAALTEIGTVPGDRIEHAAVVPAPLLPMLRDVGVTVVTQPSLPFLRGDDYLDGVDPDDLDGLWPFASLLDAGVPVGCSSDAPYGDLDPWLSIRAAVDRRTASGRPIAGHERVAALTALGGYLSPASRPGGPPRTIGPQQPADLVLLDEPLAEVLAAPAADRVVATMIRGEIVHQR